MARDAAEARDSDLLANTVQRGQKRRLDAQREAASMLAKKKKSKAKGDAAGGTGTLVEIGFVATGVGTTKKLNCVLCGVDRSTEGGNAMKHYRSHHRTIAALYDQLIESGTARRTCVLELKAAIYDQVAKRRIVKPLAQQTLSSALFCVQQQQQQSTERFNMARTIELAVSGRGFENLNSSTSKLCFAAIGKQALTPTTARRIFNR